MKKIAIAVAFILSISSLSGQRSVDRLFEKYSDDEGFTCITVSGNLLNIEASLEDDGDDRDIKAKISEVRILTRKNHNDSQVNFHDIVRRDIDGGDYEEFLSVKEAGQDLRVLVKSQGRRITEMLMVAGGNENAIIQVKGNMSVSDARRLCDRKKHGSDIF